MECIVFAAAALAIAMVHSICNFDLRIINSTVRKRESEMQSESAKVRNCDLEIVGLKKQFEVLFLHL